MKVILFGFTGLGNAVMRGLLKSDSVNLLSVFTKKYLKPYPFYDEVQLEDFCFEQNIDCHLDRKVNSEVIVNLLKESEPDLIIVSSFNQIISNKIIKIPKLGIINVHPSLLPKYRGPYPDQAVLFYGEKETGVTIHYLTDRLDSGNILMQRKLKIKKTDNYSSLKKRLADLSENMIPDVLNLFKGKQKPAGIVQNETHASFFPKFSFEDGFLENENDTAEIMNKIRALNPFPGTSIFFNGKRINVNRFRVLGKRKNGKDPVENDEYIDLHLKSSYIRLFKNN